MTKFLRNLMAAYNEAINEKKMSEEDARKMIEEKYNVVFTNWEEDRYTLLIKLDQPEARQQTE